MRILISGASGTVGGALSAQFRTSGHDVVPLVRRRDASGVYWNPQADEIDAAGMAGADVVVHLAGESIAKGRWTQAKKRRIRDSRVQGTGLIARAAAESSSPPGVLVCASAIGLYGDRGATPCDEDTAPGEGFLCDTCREWEAAADPAREAGIRVVHVRIGLVLTRREGVMAKMIPLFRWGLGGVLGSGRQYMSWITLRDLVGVFDRCAQDPSISGPVNGVAPEAVTNREFARALGRALRRPAWVPVPKFALRIAMGEMADAAILASTRVVPRRLVELGFEFQDPRLDPAIAWALEH